MLLSPYVEEHLLPNAELKFYKNFYSTAKSKQFFEALKNETSWKKYKFKIFGKEYDQPRLTAFYDNSGNGYTYSNIDLQEEELTPLLHKIKDDIQKVTKYEFNSVLLNLYRNGNDSTGWHADNEPELGLNPVIASLSLGEPRYFYIKHIKIKPEAHKILLNEGSLLIMAGEMQHYWKHQIAKTKKNIKERLNLTFRNIIS